MTPFGSICIVLFVFILHPEEESARLWLDLKEVHAVLGLLNLLKLCDVWEENQRLEHLLRLVTEVERHHAGLHWAGRDSDPTSASVRSDHAAIVVHFACSKLAESGRTTRHASTTSATHLLQERLELSLIHI